MRTIILVLSLSGMSLMAMADEMIIKTRDAYGRAVFTNSPEQAKPVLELADRSVYKWRDESGRVVYGNRSTAPADAEPVVGVEVSSERSDAVRTEHAEAIETRVPYAEAALNRSFLRDADQSPDSAVTVSTEVDGGTEPRLSRTSLDNSLDEAKAYPQDVLASAESRYGSWPIVGIAGLLLLAAIGLATVLHKLLLTPWQRSTIKGQPHREIFR